MGSEFSNPHPPPPREATKKKKKHKTRYNKLNVECSANLVIYLKITNMKNDKVFKFLVGFGVRRAKFISRQYVM